MRMSVTAGPASVFRRIFGIPEHFILAVLLLSLLFLRLAV